MTVPILLKWSDQTDPSKVVHDLPGNLRSAAAVHPTIVLHLTSGMALHLARAVERGGRRAQFAEGLAQEALIATQAAYDDCVAKLQSEARKVARDRRRADLILILAAVFTVVGWAGLILRAVTA